MNQQSEKKYLLVIKRDTNNYLPIEWNLFQNYDGIDTNSLENIDKFTKSITRAALLKETINLNILDLNDKFTSFAIIYYENGKTRELKEGVIFKEDIEILSEQKFIDFIIENANNKSLLNEIYNICNSKNKELHLEEFKYILKNINLFLQKGPNGLRAALNRITEIPYDLRRSIIIRVSENIYPKVKFINESIKLNKKDKNKVA